MAVRMSALGGAAILSLLALGERALAQGFSEPGVVLYGKIVQFASGSSFQIYEGTLEMSLANQGNPANNLTVQAVLKPGGEGAAYSYSMVVPQRFLPRTLELDSVLSTGASPTGYRIERITVDGFPATPLDDSLESFTTSFAQRAQQIRVDLRVTLPQSDQDADGLPDWWEEQHGLNPSFAGDAQADDDQDGRDNLSEFGASTDPRRSNRTPTLRTTRLRVPERGRAGFLLDVVDSDSPPDEISLRLISLSDGLVLRRNGTPLAPRQSFSLADVGSGSLILAHETTGPATGALDLEFHDPDGPTNRASLEVLVFQPSLTDGTDATLWLDAYDIASNNNARLAEWPDRSGGNHDAWQPENDHRPQFKASVEGRPAVDFGGNRRHFLLEDPAFPIDGVSFFAVFDAPRTGSREQVLAANRFFIGVERSGGNTPYPGALSVSRNQAQIPGRIEVRDRRVVASVHIDDARGATHTNFRYDGSAQPLPTPEAPVEPALGLMRLAGVSGNSRFSRDFDGLIREILVFPNGMNEVRRRRVADYLESKWQGAVIWEWSDEGSPVTVQGGSGRDIIRGGWGADVLRAGAGEDVIAGGPGDDVLAGQGGADTFVYGPDDRGRDVIRDFIPEGPDHDVLDLAGMLEGLEGDPREFLALRAEGVRVGDDIVTRTILTVRTAPGSAPVQEIVLENVALTDADLGRLIGEGVIATGNLGIPVTLSIAANTTSRAEPGPSVVLSRLGNTDHAMPVPLYLSDADGSEPGFALANAEGTADRKTVTFARGESLLTVPLVPGRWVDELARIQILPQAHYETDQASAEVLLEGAAAGDAYVAWAAEVFPSNASPSATRPDSDFDADGVANLAEFLFGTSPTDQADGTRHPLRIAVEDGRLALRFTTAAISGPLEVDLLRRNGVTEPEHLVTDTFDDSHVSSSQGKTLHEYRSKSPVSDLPGQAIYRLRVRWVTSKE